MFRLIVLAALVACVLGGRVQQELVAKTDERIVGGQEGDIKDFPFLVSLRLKILIINIHQCGGSIIGDKYVLTAAHCVSGILTVLLSIVAGTSSTSSGGTTHYIKNIAINQYYDSDTMENDVAVITVSIPFTYSNKIQPIALPSANEYFPDGFPATAAGWGTLSEGGPSPTIFHYVEVPLINWSNCSIKYEGYEEIYVSMVCAGVPEGGKDSCQGDSGGPLIVHDEDNPILAGVVSWGIGCARPGFPGVYADVGYNRDWIISKMV